MTDREKSFLFGRIQRMFGECAKKCGRIASSPQAKVCKARCISDRDHAIKKARAKAQAEKRHTRISKYAKKKGLK